MSVELTVLDNGLRVVTDRVEGVETASVGVFVDVGTRHEAPEVNGVAHLLEHMAFKGTMRRDARRIAEEIETVGGQLNAYTSRETTCYYAKVLKADVGLALDILGDILQNSVFDAAELDRERGVILQEIGQAEDTPDDIIFDRFQAAAYPDQALGRPVLGQAEIVRTIARERVAGYLAQHYAAERMVLSAAGAVDHARLVDQAAAAFDALPRSRPAAPEPARYAGGEWREEKDLEQIHLVLGFPAVAHADPDYYAVQTLSVALGGGMSSRLFQEIREKRGLVYSIYSFATSYEDAGIFAVYAGTGEDEVEALIPVLCDEIAGIADKLSEAEVTRARAQLKAGLLMGLESSSARAEQHANNLLIFDRIVSTEETVAKLDAVTRAEVARVARRIFTGTPTLAALGPVAGVERLDRMRRRLGSGAS